MRPGKPRHNGGGGKAGTGCWYTPALVSQHSSRLVVGGGCWAHLGFLGSVVSVAAGGGDMPSRTAVGSKDRCPLEGWLAGAAAMSAPSPCMRPIHCSCRRYWKWKKRRSFGLLGPSLRLLVRFGQPILDVNLARRLLEVCRRASAAVPISTRQRHPLILGRLASHFILSWAGWQAALRKGEEASPPCNVLGPIPASSCNGGGQRNVPAVAIAEGRF